MFSNITENLDGVGSMPTNVSTLEPEIASEILANSHSGASMSTLTPMAGPSFEVMQELERMDKITNIVVPTVIIIILILGLAGNAMVVYVTIVTNRTTKHPIHSIFVLNLAVADVLFLVFCAPYWIVITSTAAYRFGPVLCPLFPFFSTSSMAASVYTICALAWMRFMALVMPFRFRRSRISTRKAGYFVVAAIWVASALLALPTLVYYRIHTVEILINHEEIVECQWIGERSQYAFAIVKLLVAYIIPLILVTVFYAIIGREVLCFMMKHGGTNSNTCDGRNNTEEQKECAKSTMVVLSLILAFLICWFPHLLETVFKMTGVNAGVETVGAIKSRYILEAIGKCMSYAHACINPFIYTFASPVFRHSLRTSLKDSLLSCSRRLCGSPGLQSCSRRVKNRKRPVVGQFKLQQNSPDATSVAKEEQTQRTAMLRTSANDGRIARTENIALTCLDHHTIHTTVSPQTSPVHSNGNFPQNQLLLVHESDETTNQLLSAPDENELREISSQSTQQTITEN